MSDRTDTALVDAALAGDKEAFGQLLIGYQATPTAIAW